jgi:hypothetical protein
MLTSEQRAELAHVRQQIEAMDQQKPGQALAVNWQRVVCFLIPLGNIALEVEGIPPIPLPAFCTTPAPTPTK